MRLLIKYILFGFIFFIVQAETFVIDASENAVWHNTKALELYKDGYLNEAVQELKIAISLSPNSTASASFFNNLGSVYFDMNKFELAIKCFEKAIKLNPNFLEYYFNLLKAHKAQGTIKKLAKNHINILKKDEYNSRSWLILGLANYELGAKKHSIKCLEHFANLEPDLVITKGVKSLLNTKVEESNRSL